MVFSKQWVFGAMFLCSMSFAHVTFSEAQTGDDSVSNDDSDGGETTGGVEDDNAAANGEPGQGEVETTAGETPAGTLPPPLLRDVNGDGQTNATAFGDSITRGTGDFTEPGADIEIPSQPSGEAGYPLRVERFLGISVSNLGDPGEVTTVQGLPRFADQVPRQGTDFVIISGGSNDALRRAFRSDYFRTVQTMINIADANGLIPIVATIPLVCCNHDGLQPSVDSYNDVLRTLSVVNQIAIADIDRGFRNTCNNRRTDCRLLNLPEGLHPNSEGYDVSGEVVTATLLGINIFAPDGPALLAQALMISPNDIETVPDPLPPSGTPTPVPTPVPGSARADAGT